MSELRLEDVIVEARGQRLIDGVTLSLARGALIALVGPNGAGKTTLLRAALGLVRPRGGHVTIDGEELARLSARERAARLSWLPQHVFVTEAIPALELVAAARYRFREGRRRSLEAARAALERVGAAALGPRIVQELSGGERQRVALAGALAQETPFVLLDEPANHLDPAQQLEVYELIGALWQSGLGVLLVTHDVNLLAQLGDAARVTVVGLAAGRTRFTLSYDDAKLFDELGALFGLELSVVTLGDRRVAVAARSVRS
ncbi:MAG: ABC transporter ATP-binding protein [Sorangiineae bacterium]|nr:ABC transporter ATP-binding protein [Polyangiaceae bacterium]MEB2322317.1 ABC transporter ATP-binding protein [Sorangiineae bacterium]